MCGFLESPRAVFCYTRTEYKLPVSLINNLVGVLGVHGRRAERWESNSESTFCECDGIGIVEVRDSCVGPGFVRSQV